MIGMVVLLKFLHDFGYPWLSLRMGVRENSSEKIDFMWNLSMLWFRATNKTNYAAMAVNVGLLHELMGGALKRTWRTARPASWVAWGATWRGTTCSNA